MEELIGTNDLDDTVFETTFFIEIMAEVTERIHLAEATRRSLNDCPKAEPPASSRLIEALETVKVKDSGPLRGSDSCGICISDFQPGQECIILGCQHSFHKSCILPWFKQTRTCPSCRFSIKDTD